ncbi:unnamed protein product [Sphagnum tenellum]
MQVSSFCHSSSLAFNLVQNLLLPSWDLWPQDCWRQQAGHSVMRKCSAILSVVSSLQILNLPDVCAESGDREGGGGGGGSNGGQSTIHREELVPGKVLAVDPSCMSYICSSPSRSPP